MSDLIDRNVTIEEFYKRIGGDLDALDAERAEKVIKEVPVVFDTNKVIEQLNQINKDDDICFKLRHKNPKHCKNTEGCFECAINEAIETIKSALNQ